MRILFGVLLAFTLVSPAHAATPADVLRAGAELGVRDGYPGVIGLVRNKYHLLAGTRGQRDVGKAAVDAYCAL